MTPRDPWAAPHDDDAADAALGRVLGELAPVEPDADAALDGLVPRYRRARARRRGALVGGSAAVVAALVALGLAVAPGDGDGRSTQDVVADGDGTTTTAPAVTTSAPPTTTTDAPPTTTTTTPGTTASTTPPTTAAPPTGAGGTEPPATTTPTSPTSEPTASTDAPGTGGPGTGSTASTTPPSSAPPPTRPPQTETVTSRAGDVEVRWDGTSVTLVGTRPAAGWTEERHDVGPDRVEVRFTRDGDEVRVRLEVRDGVLERRIT